MRTIAITMLACLSLAGCLDLFGGDDERTSLAELGWDGQEWPDLSGHTVRVLAYDSFQSYAEDELKPAFEDLTGATVEFQYVNDAGEVKQRVLQEKGDPAFDVAYGLDNALVQGAIDAGALEEYQPILANGIDDRFIFLDTWHATPVNHGYIAVNVDPALGAEVETLNQVRAHADRFVASDPRFSSPGLGFLIATVAVYGEDDAYDYLDYWADLLDGGVRIEESWGQAYGGHFSGAGAWTDGSEGYNNQRDRAIVTSYTTSPAFEFWADPGFYDDDPQKIPAVVVEEGSVFHQIQTMAIPRGADNLAAAQAWVEFSLTEPFQHDSVWWEAIYPVVLAHDVSEGVYGDVAPAPANLTVAPFDAATLGAKTEEWVQAWTDLFEAKTA